MTHSSHAELKRRDEDLRRREAAVESAIRSLSAKDEELKEREQRISSKEKQYIDQRSITTSESTSTKSISNNFSHLSIQANSSNLNELDLKHRDTLYLSDGKQSSGFGSQDNTLHALPLLSVTHINYDSNGNDPPPTSTPPLISRLPYPSRPTSAGSSSSSDPLLQRAYSAPILRNPLEERDVAPAMNITNLPSRHPSSHIINNNHQGHPHHHTLLHTHTLPHPHQPPPHHHHHHHPPPPPLPFSSSSSTTNGLGKEPHKQLSSPKKLLSSATNMTTRGIVPNLQGPKPIRSGMISPRVERRLEPMLLSP